MRKDIETIIFDFDATLADTWPLHLAAWQSALKYYHLPFPKKQVEALLNEGHSSFEIALSLSLLSENARKIAERKRHDFDQLFKENGKLFQGAVSTVKKLYQRGYSLVILTDHSSKYLNMFLKENKIAGFFPLILKPPLIHKRSLSKKALRAIFLENGILLKRSIYIGDSGCDINFCKKMGMTGVLIRNTHIKQRSLRMADIVINRLEDLINIVPVRIFTVPEGVGHVLNVYKKLNTRDKLVIGIGGGTAAGKSFFASKLKGAILSLDSYYKDLKQLKKEKRDFYEPGSLFLDKAKIDIEAWRKGRVPLVPVYNIREYQRQGLRKLRQHNMLIVEGLFALQKPVLDVVSLCIFIDCQFPLMLKRKKYRGIVERRNRPWIRTLHRFKKIVLPCYNKYIRPQKGFADIIIKNDQIA